MKELAELGIAPADRFNWNRLSTAQQAAITNAVASRTSTGLPTRVANDIAHNVGVSQVSNGWTERLDPTEIGAYSTHYDARAVIAIRPRRTCHRMRSTRLLLLSRYRLRLFLNGANRLCLR